LNNKNPGGKVPDFTTSELTCIKPSQVKLLITNNAICIVQRTTAQSKKGMFRDCGVAEAPPGFQAGWSDCMYFEKSLW
jgi:hypothetical protein